MSKPRTPRDEQPLTRPVRLLHLSDLHFSAKRAWDQDPVLAGLAVDVAVLRERLGEFHRVVVTGDIADWGKKEEFDKAAAWLTGPLARAAGVGAAEIRVVPGNHDVDRSRINRVVVNQDAAFVASGDDEIAAVMADPELREMVLRRQSAFLDFARQFHPKLELPWWRSDETIAGWAVRLIGLNTAWMAGSHKTSSGEVDDHRHLALGGWQWNALFAADPPGAEAPDLTIALMHHPWEDLVERDRTATEAPTLNRCGVVLRGHLHKAESFVLQGPDTHVLPLAAGACYADASWPHGYQVIELEPGEGRARVHLRRWHGHTRRWTPDSERWPEHASDGVAALNLRRSPRAPAGVPKAPGPAPVVQMRAPDPESRLRSLIADRIGELPAVFELDGKRHALSEVYVELALSPESLPHLKGCDAEVQKISHIEDVLTHPVRRWTLCGEAGCGKTTLLHHLADTLLNDRVGNLLPVPLRVAELQRGDRLLSAVSRAYDVESAALVVNACGAGRAVILLDGLDEAVSPEDARAAVQSLAADSGKSVLIVSSRDTAYTRPGAGFGELRVLPLTDDQQLDLLSRWVGTTRARAELAPLARRPRLARMAKNPLLLTLMGLVLLREPGSTLPAKRAELYERAAGLLLRGAHRPELKRRFDDPPLVREVLARLALALHGQEQTTWPLGRLRDVIEADGRAWPQLERQWRSADRFLEDVAQVSDLLVPEGPRGDPRGYRFPHRTFREYLASVALADDLSRNGLGEVSRKVLQRVARGEPPAKLKLPKGELNTVLADGVKRPDIWAEVLALTAGQLGAGGPDRLVRGVAAAGDRRLLLRVVADADGLKTDTVDAALALERGWRRWEALRKILEDLPGLVGDPAAVVSLLRRFVASTTDGNDLYWARESLKTIAAGKFPGEAVEGSVREEAAAAVARLFDHMQGALPAVHALLKDRWSVIPKGSFRMGGTKNEDEKPIHDVHITSNFLILNIPVTWEMYRLFDPGHDAARDPFDGRLPPGQQAQVPVYHVTWYAATIFAAWVGARLPLEPEWEYACRAGTTTRYWNGDKELDLARVGWYDQNSSSRPHPVGQKPANPWGLHDMHGNVWEWCQDSYQDNVYAARASGMTVDPIQATCAVGKGPQDLADPGARGDRVLRGGSWYNWPEYAHSSNRSRNSPSHSFRNIGFRLVKPIPLPPPDAT